eukprot:gene26183-14025_t
MRPVVPPALSGDVAAFVARCLVADPGKRPSARELLNDVFLCAAGLCGESLYLHQRQT